MEGRKVRFNGVSLGGGGGGGGGFLSYTISLSLFISFPPSLPPSLRLSLVNTNEADQMRQPVTTSSKVVHIH